MNGNRTIWRARELSCVLTLVTLLGLATSVRGQARRAGAAAEAQADPAAIEQAVAAARGAVKDEARRVALRPLAESVGGRVALLKLMTDTNEAMRHMAMTVMAQDYRGTEKALREDAYKEFLPAALEQLIEEACMPRATPFNAPWDVLERQIGKGADLTTGLIKNFTSDDEKRRRAAANLLQLAEHSREIREAVIKALGDGNRDVRDISGRWLMSDGPAGRAALLEAIKSPNPMARAMAVNFVDSGSNQKLSPEMIVLMGNLMMHDADRDVRDRAADRLRYHGGRGAIGVFTEAIRSGSKEVRHLAAEKMGGGKEAADALLPLLDEKDSAVRIAALGALSNGERRDYFPLGKVVRLLDDSDLEISKAAAVALQEWRQRGPVSARRIGSLRAVSDIRGMRTEYDRDPPVEPPAPAWRMPEVQSSSSPAGSVDAGDNGAAAGAVLTPLTLVVLGAFGVLVVVRRAGLIGQKSVSRVG